MNQPILLKDQPRSECFVDAAQQFPALDPSATFAFTTLLHSHDALWKRMSAHFAQHGITQGRFMVLIMLMEKEGDGCPTVHTPAEIAEQLQITRASVTGLLDSLEKDAFVRREPDPNDRRMMSIHLTEKGQSFLDDFLPPHFELIAKLMTGLSVKERESLVRLLNKLVGGIQELNDA
ncbi:MAG: MarR family winged helix-turn-helix transcriptional regulator [Coraliomargarita sp.]